MGEIAPHPIPAPATLSPPLPLQPSHELSRFDCGNAALNDWLRHKALRSERQTARCYAVTERNIVVGYCCLAAGVIRHEGAPPKLRKNAPDPTPVVIIGRLMVDKAFQGKGADTGMLKDALLRIAKASEMIGARAVIVHAIGQDAVRFYVRHGFRSFPTGHRTLLLTIDKIVGSL